MKSIVCLSNNKNSCSMEGTLGIVKIEARLPATVRYFYILRDLALEYRYFNVAFGGNAIQSAGCMEMFGHSLLSFLLILL